MVKFSSEFQKFLQENNYKLIDNLFNGRVGLYKSNYAAIRIVQDNDLAQSIEKSFNQNVNAWYDLGRISTLINTTIII